MSDEIFFREVNEEIRQERTRLIWARYGRLIIVGAVLSVVAAGAYVFWREYEAGQANAAGDRYLAAIDLSKAGNLDGALTELQALSTDGFGTYRYLARMRLATVREAQGDQAGAVTAFDEIADDTSAPDSLRDIAAVRAAYILVDTGTQDDVAGRVQSLSGDTEPLRYAAREALGLAAWKAGDLPEAKRWFEQLSDDQGTPAGIGLRTRVMLDLVNAGTLPVAGAAAPAPGGTATPAVTPAPNAPAAEGAAATPAPVAPSAPAASTTSAPATAIPQAEPVPTATPSSPVPTPIAPAPAAVAPSEAPATAPQAAPAPASPVTDAPPPAAPAVEAAPPASAPASDPVAPASPAPPPPAAGGPSTPAPAN